MAPFSPDARQAEALAHERGPMLVTGGPGSGKTAVLRERFARLIEGGADPERVALVLGSRRARDEARRALFGRLDRSLPGLHVLTVHGLANHVLIARHAELGYATPPQILSAADQFAMVQQLLQDQNPKDWPAYGAMLPMRGFVDQVRQFLSRAQEALLSPEDIEARARGAGLTGWVELATFLREYQRVLDDTGAVDFAGMLQQVAAVAGKGDTLFDHVLADDFQDTTLAAEELLAGLAADDLVVAGDPDAHVFSFQGFTDVPIRRFTDRFAGARVVALEGSHRAPERPGVEGWYALHTSEEHAAIARELRRLHVEDAVPWGELAVVVRRQETHVAGLLRALDDARVPRVVPERGLSVTSEPATSPFVLALRWLARPAERDDLAEAVLTSDLIRLSPATARGLIRGSSRDGPGILERTEGLSPAEAEQVAEVRSALERADAVASRSVSDAFRILWEELPFARSLVAEAEHSPEARRELDAVVAFHDLVEEQSASADPSVQGFVEAIDAGQHGPGFLTAERERPDAVHVLTAHGSSGREFDTLVVAGAVEGNFPSLARPEPMFDLEVLDGPVSQSERNRARLEDERRLFRMVMGRARRHVLLTASEPHAQDAETSGTTRFAGEHGVLWWPAPHGPYDEPVSVAEATASWRRTLADLSAANAQRLAALEGLAALGSDPRTWWFQREWTDTGRPLRQELRVSYSRLSNLDNCELQHVLGDELGLGKDAGYAAWVGKTVHELIERCEKGEVEKTAEAVLADVDANWRADKFPSKAVSEAWRRLVKERMLPNWLKSYGPGESLAVEQYFEFEFEGALIVGVIDRISPLERGGTRIIDFKTGNPDYAGKPEQSLQLGIYYLAVQECEELEPFRPVRAVELGFLKGDWRTGETKPFIWQVTPNKEEAYQAAVRTSLSALIARKRELNLDEVYRPNPRANCRFCEFKSLCPLYPEGAPLFERSPA
jgi:superfamily I DNA/RNA helicase/RecB family exonuclease